MRLFLILLFLIPISCYSQDNIVNNLTINSNNINTQEIVIPRNDCKNNKINPNCLSKVELNKLVLLKKEQKRIEKDSIKNDDDSFIGNVIVLFLIFTIFLIFQKK